MHLHQNLQNKNINSTEHEGFEPSSVLPHRISSPALYQAKIIFHLKVGKGFEPLFWGLQDPRLKPD